MYIKKNHQEITLNEVEEYPGFKDNEGVLYYVTNNDSGSHALAVFAGKVFRELLGEYQPDYHLAVNGTMNSRACNWLEDFAVFQIDENSPQHIKYKETSYSFAQVRHFTAVILAGYFLGEADWENSNIGFVPDQQNPGGLVAVRIDPGCSFQFQQAETFAYDWFEQVLTDPFRMIIGGINCQAYKEGHFKTINEYYFAELLKDTSQEHEETQSLDESTGLEDSASESNVAYGTRDTMSELLAHLDYRVPELQNLLNKQDEIKRTMNNIVILETETLKRLAAESGLDEDESKNAIATLNKRKKVFTSLFYDTYGYGALVYPSDDETEEESDVEEEFIGEVELSDSDIPLQDYRSLPSHKGMFAAEASKKRSAHDELPEDAEIDRVQAKRPRN